MTKLHEYNPAAKAASSARQYWFFCPGCKYTHGFTVDGDKHWKWNGSMDKPTFTPSLLCNKDFPESRCHSYVTDGRIQFLSDCFHTLAGQIVDIPDWED